MYSSGPSSKPDKKGSTSLSSMQVYFVFHIYRRLIFWRGWGFYSDIKCPILHHRNEKTSQSESYLRCCIVKKEI